MSNLFINRVSLNRNKIINFDEYPFNIGIIRDFNELKFTEPVTFLIGENGLYILDEPEAALSPERQMTLLCLIDDLVKRGSQFIIATHSPILISYYKGVILDIDNNFKVTKYEDTKIYSLYKLYLDNPYGMQKRLFNEED